MSILSVHPDGMGFYYGFPSKADLRRIDVREEGAWWTIYICGEPIDYAASKDDAEYVALQYIARHPADVQG